MDKYNKHTIYARMADNANSYFGNDFNIDASDPVVKLLLQACASEASKIYEELEDSQSRVLERLSHLLIPDVYRGAKPAHAIMHSSPIKNNVTVNRKSNFYSGKKLQLPSGDEISMQVDFTPIEETRLFCAEVQHLVTEDTVYNIAATGHKSAIGTKFISKKINKNELWISIKPEPGLNDLSGIRFFFDWTNVSNRSELADNLQHAQWYINDKKIERKSNGIYSTYSPVHTRDKLNAENDFEESIFRSVSNYYSRNFITCGQFECGPDAIMMPDVFTKCFDESILSQFQNLIWVKIVFPAVKNAELNKIIVACNCFPVVNRKLHSDNRKISEYLNVVPLAFGKGELFFNMHSVKSLNNNGSIDIGEASSKNLKNFKDGFYFLRRKGIERFSSRSAREYIANLMDLIEDENPAFRIHDNGEFIEREKQESAIAALRRISEIMEPDDDFIGEDTIYLILKPSDYKSDFQIQYWSTMGSFANNIDAYSVLNQGSAEAIDGASIYLLSPTVHGKEALDSKDSIASFKQALLSRDRIVTEADICAFTYAELSDSIKDISITRGTMLWPESKIGIIPTIEISLTPASNSKTDQEWAAICDELAQKIKPRFSGLTPIKFIFKI